MLFSAQPAVSSYVYLNSRGQTTPAQGLIALRPTLHIITYSYKVLFFLCLLTVEDPCGA
jgi:hypothetical protein